MSLKCPHKKLNHDSGKSDSGSSFRNKYYLENFFLEETTLFVLIFARTNFRDFAQKNPFAREN